MADWVHCNICFHRPGSGAKFNLNSCGHIICNGCLDSGSKGQTCSKCKAPCTVMHLTNQLSSDVEVYFMDPAELVRKQHKQLSKVLEFQKIHKANMNEHFKEMENQRANMMSQAKKAMGHIQDLEREVSILKDENIKIKKILHNMGIPTPCSSGRFDQKVQMVCSHNRPYAGNVSSRSSNPPNMMIPPAGSHVHSPSGSSRSTPPYTLMLRQQVENSLNSSSNKGTPPMASRVSIRTPPSNGSLESPLTDHSPKRKISPKVHSSQSSFLHTPPQSYHTPLQAYSQPVQSHSRLVETPPRKLIQVHCPSHLSEFRDRQFKQS